MPGPSKVRRIEVDFGAEVEISDHWLQQLHAGVSLLCRDYNMANPGRTMWVFGVGAKMMVHPMMVEDDKPIPFDEGILHIECSEREELPEEKVRREKRDAKR